MGGRIGRGEYLHRAGAVCGVEVLECPAQQVHRAGLHVLCSGEVDGDRHRGDQGPGPGYQRVEGVLVGLGQAAGDDQAYVGAVKIDLDRA